MVVRVEVSAPSLSELALAVKYEEDGAVMRREFVRNLRAAVAPAAEEAKASIMSMTSTGLREKGGPLRTAIAKQVKTQVSLSKRQAKVTVRVRKGGYPRGFKNAPKAFSMAGGWRHPVFQTGRWVAQIGKPGWFDAPLKAHRERYRAAVQEAMNHTADRISRKVV